MMRGKPLPGKAPSQPTPASQRRETDKAIEHIDERMGKGRDRELLVHVSPDPPGRKVGRPWLRPRQDS